MITTVQERLEQLAGVDVPVGFRGVMREAWTEKREVCAWYSDGFEVQEPPQKFLGSFNESQRMKILLEQLVRSGEVGAHAVSAVDSGELQVSTHTIYRRTPVGLEIFHCYLPSQEYMVRK